jgi:peptide/nickel transport system permease protein
MLRFAAHRLLSLLPTLFGMSIVIFLLVRLLPGDVSNALLGDVVATQESRAALRHALGLDQPFPLQYVRWIGGLVHGDAGHSLITGRPVAAVLGSALPVTVELALLATIVATLIAIPLGVASATRPNSRRDFAVRTGGLLGLSIPDFWLATIVLLVTSVFFHWTPSVIWVPFFRHPVGNLEQVAIPAVILAVFMIATTMRMARTTMLEVLGQDYIRTARAKGVPRRSVVYRHALRNALIPIITVIGFQFGALLSGATILEVIFGFPGVGYTLTQAIYRRDYPVIEDAALVLAFIFLLLNLSVDILYAMIDPRIKQR